MTNSTASLNPALRDFWTAPARNRVLYGGRASSKTWDAAGFATFLSQACKIRVLCVRQFQNKIAESVYTNLKIQIERFGLSNKFKIIDNSISCNTTGSEFLFYGLWRHINEIKGVENVDILWIEEAHALTKEQWDILEPTIRKTGSQVWVIFNPHLATDFAYKRFVVNPPPDTIVRLINYDENPFLSDTMLKIIEAKKAEDYEDYLHIYRGVPLDDDDEAIIKRSWAMAAIGAHTKLGIKPTGSKRIGYDIADSGKDLCANVYAYGQLASWSDLWKAKEHELLKSSKRVWNKARDLNASITYDSIGVGAGTGSHIKELNKDRHEGLAVEYTPFNAGGAVFRPESFYTDRKKNKDMFANIKAQAWWLVADRLKNTYNAIHNGQKFKDDEMIFIDEAMPNLGQLIEELSTPKRDFDKTGKVKVESKEDLLDRDIASPNLADAFIMAFAPLQQPMRIDKGLLNRA